MATRGRSTSPCKWVVWTLLMMTSSAWKSSIEATAIMGVCTTEPAVRLDCYPPVENFPAATEEACLAQGCCWKPLNNSGIPCAFDAIGEPHDSLCQRVPRALRMECRNPRFASRELDDDAESCQSAGCCFDEDAYQCFQPFFEGYELLTLKETDDGWRGTLVLRRFTRGPFGNDVSLLALHVVRETTTRVRIRITDPSFPRYEVSDVAVPSEDTHHRSGESSSRGGGDSAGDEYKVHLYKSPFGIAVTRRETNEVLFNSTPSIHAEKSFNGLVFENQFLEVSTKLESHDAVGSPVLYGLGERWGRARLHADHRGDHFPMFSRSAHEITSHAREGGDNLSGVHPFYLQVLSSGRSHGVFFLSSNAMEVVTLEDALSFRSTGGVLDFFVFAGPTAHDVTREYTQVVGRPEMPPLWALGYHFGKRGHRSLEETVLDVTKLREMGVPLDVYWQDVDYMKDREAFTLDGEAFPLKSTRAFVDDLHFHNQYYVMAVSPAIPTEPTSADAANVIVVAGRDDLECRVEGGGSVNDEDSEEDEPGQPGYLPLDRGTELDIFVKGVDGEGYAEKLVGRQWSLFVDFFHPNASIYWHEMLRNFCDQVLPFDGVWMSSNEPSASCDRKFSGQNHMCDEHSSDEVSLKRLGRGIHDSSFVRSSDVAFPFDPYRQPFVPGQNTATRGGHGNLNAVTLPMASLHHSSLHYNLHSLYGHEQSKTTRYALDRVLKHRSLVMSRATYAGDGQFSGHLFGEVDATWENLRLSIAGVIQMNLLGLPLSGPTIGGNGLGISKELSIRWHQAASFFPLVRNHASEDAEPQSAVDFDRETANIVRETLLQRYRHLPYIYTQFYLAHTDGMPVIRGLAFDFPTDRRAYDVETQYLVGSALMVSPVVDEGVISTRVYFPNATWYELDSGRMVIGVAQHSASSRSVRLLTPLQSLQVHIRGGSILPTQEASTTTAITKRGTYRLVIALDPTQEEPAARGELFVDDGDSLNSVEDCRYSLLSFEASVKHDGSLELHSKRDFHGYDGPEMSVDLDQVVVLGLRGHFFGNSSLRVHGFRQPESVKVSYFQQSSMLVISNVKLPIGEEFSLRVEARNGGGREEAGDETGDPAGDGRKGSRGQGGGDDETHGDTKPSEGDHGEHKEPPHAEEEQHHRKKGGVGVYGIAGIIIGAAFVAVLAFVVFRRHRPGYRPIAG